jgi:hypothetical protein
MFPDTQLDHSANDFDALFEMVEVEVDSQLRAMGVDPDELSKRAVEFVDLAKHEQSR